MATKPKDPPEPKRFNRAVGVAEALTGVLDSALRKRGFASRDILTNWAAMAPKPYDLVSVPDRLAWPRSAKGAEGAILYLRCSQGHALALAHEAPLIAAAVNRYFGYVLVRDVKMSLEPFSARSAAKVQSRGPTPETAHEAQQAVSDVGDPELKQALRALGEGILGRRAPKSVTKL